MKGNDKPETAAKKDKTHRLRKIRTGALMGEVVFQVAAAAGLLSGRLGRN
ncbi:hypothetical protein [Bradyrhizobium sp.]|nr:hypothetical protein [Bradyrhizobium sp.]